MDVKFACQSARYAAYLVASHTKDGQYYLVEYDSRDDVPGYREGWKCNCPAFTYREGQCKHIKTAKPRICGWDQALHPESQPIRNGDGRLHCPVCSGDVYAYEDIPAHNLDEVEF